METSSSQLSSFQNLDLNHAPDNLENFDVQPDVHSHNDDVTPFLGHHDMNTLDYQSCAQIPQILHNKTEDHLLSNPIRTQASHYTQNHVDNGNVYRIQNAPTSMSVRDKNAASGRITMSRNPSGRLHQTSKFTACPSPKRSMQKQPIPSTAQERTKLFNKRVSKHQHVSSTMPSRPCDQPVAAIPGIPGQTDPFTHWYQMMSQYYSQFYPGYQLPPVQGAPNIQPSTAKSLPHVDRPTHSRVFSNSVLPQKPSLPSVRQASQLTSPASTFGSPSALDYAYYYQYYYGPAAAQLWAAGLPIPTFDQMGRKTPKHFHSPHIRASLSVPGILLQVLPNRPSDGELPLVEMIDLSELAHQAVAEATKRASEAGGFSELNRFQELNLNREEFSSGTSGLDSPDRLSSFQAGGGGDEDGDEARAYDAIAMAWDRTDHIFYPGPLDRTNTLKADVLAFLREKLTEIQDRLPTDWESAALLVTYLEWMVKNNGDVQPSDLVNLLLDGHKPYTGKFREENRFNHSKTTSIVASHQVAPRGSFDSLPVSEPPSGRQSPYTIMSSSAVHAPRATKAASECGAYVGSDTMLMRANHVTDNRTSVFQGADFEDEILDRFRELLMHGMSMKALEHACRTQLWGHALALAKHISPAVFEKVMEKFITRAVAPADPILTFYQMAAGEIPQAVTNVACGRGADIGEWRPHLAMVIATEAAQPELAQSVLQRFGDGLLSRRLVYAAHLCYLLMGPLYDRNRRSNSQPVYHLPEKIWLLGVPVVGLDGSGATLENQSPISASTEAIQLTEIYEYTMKLANKNYRLPQLLPFKLIYATRLIDAGLLNKANRYLAAIGQELLLEAHSQDILSSVDVSPAFYSLVDNCLRLAEPLQCHPELDELVSMPLPASNRSTYSNRLEPGGPVSTGWVKRLRELYHELMKKLHKSPCQLMNLDLSKESQLVHNTKVEASTPAETPSPPSQQLPPKPRMEDKAAQRHSRDQHYESVQSDLIASSHVAYGYPVDLERRTPHNLDPTHINRSYPTQPHDGLLGSSDVPGQLPQPPSSSSPFHRNKEESLPGSRPTPTCGIDSSCHTSSPGSSTLPPQTRPCNPPDPCFSYYDHPQEQHRRPHQAGALPMVNLSDLASSTGDSIVFPSDQGGIASHSFFTPVTKLSSADLTGLATPQPYDYFAGFQYQSTETVEGRSRTTSGGSHGSLMGPYAPSTQSSCTVTGPRSRTNSEAYQPHYNPGSTEGNPIPTCQPIYSAKPVADSHRQDQIKEESSYEEPKPKNDDDDNQQQSKDGWLSGWFGKLKRGGPKNVHLPDDKNPSIIWDDRLKRWIDVTNPDASSTAPPPPPPVLPTANMSTSSADASTPGRSGNRSRYVNVLADQTYGSAASRADGPIQPPLPPTMYSQQASEKYQC